MHHTAAVELNVRMATEDLSRRVQQLSQALLDKEREFVNSQASHAFLKQDLEAAKAELAAAREELRNEATKASLLEQRLKRVTDDLQQARLDLTSANLERDNLNRTLGRVQEQLTSLKSDSAGKGLQLTELQLYYDGLLQAKEESIRSLQALLDNQQKQFRDQQELWEEQRRSLKASLVDLSDRVAASQLAQAQAAGAAAQAAALADLRSKLAQAEKVALKAGEREQQLLELVRRREAQVARLKQRSRQGRGQPGGADAGLGDRGNALGGRAGLRLLGAGADSSEDSEDSLCGDTASSADLGALALRREKAAARDGGASGTAALQAALQEERRRQEALRSRLSVAEREADDLRAQVTRLKTQLADASRGAAAESNVQLADELLRAHRRVQDLELQLRHAREAAAASDTGSKAAANAAGGRGGGPGVLTSVEHLAIVRQRLMRQRQEFEQFLERVVGNGSLSGAGLLLTEDIKSLMDKHLTRVDTIASTSALPEGRRGLDADDGRASTISLQRQQQQQQQQYQHSLFVVRAAWSTLRRGLMTLQEAVGTSLDVSANPAIAYLQGADFLSRLMREWTVGDKAALDASVEVSMSAAVSLVQEAAGRLQAHAVDLGVAKQQLQEAQDAVAQLRLTNGLVHREGENRLAEARDEAESLRQQLERARADLAVMQKDMAARQSDVEAARSRAEAAEAAARRSEAAAATVEAERAKLRRTLAVVEGDKGSAEAAFLSREDERVRLTRALSDAQATIALLHDRLDTLQAAGSAELAALKTKIRDVVTALESPSLPQLHAMMMAAAAGGQGEGYDDAGLAAALPAPGGARSGPATPRRLGRAGGGGGGVFSEDSLNALALGLKAPFGAAVGSTSGGAGADDPWVVSGSLISALDSAASSCGAALHRMAMMEVAHFEAERGAAAVAAVRDHLASAATEMAAGRVAIGDVLLNELLSMIDDGYDTSTAPPAAATARSPGRGLGGQPRTPRAHSGGSAHTPWQLATASPGASTASGGGHWGQAPYGSGGAQALRAQLAAARDQSQHMTRHLKNVEGLLLALKSALPEWLEMATARLAARHRTELSRLRGVLGGQLSALRRDMRDLRASCSASLQEAAQQAADTLQQARRMSVAADRDRSEAAHQLTHLQQDLSTLVDVVAATTGAIAAATATGAAAGRGLPAAALISTPMASTAATAAPGLRPSSSPRREGSSESGDSATAAPSLSYSLASAAATAGRTIPELRAGLERLRRDLMGLVSERDSARASAEAAVAHGTLLVRCVADAAPLPEVLVLALMNATASPDPAMSPVWCGQLREGLAAHIAGVQAATAEGITATQVEPLRRDVTRLTDELRAAKRRVATLQAQASRFLADSGAALESCRRAAGEAAAAVLDSVMAGVRDEVTAVRNQVSELQEGSAEVIRQTNAAWAEQLAAVRTGSTAAVAALEESVAQLQAQLGSEADAYDELKAQSEAAAKNAAERMSAETQRSRNLNSELAAARERLAVLEAAETTLEGENRGLRKALRQRDVMFMGTGTVPAQEAQLPAGGEASLSQGRASALRGDVAAL